jgi:hypothetical protein
MRKTKLRMKPKITELLPEGVYHITSQRKYDDEKMGEKCQERMSDIVT